MFFHKNKRQFRFCTKRTVFCALFSFLLLCCLIAISSILNVNAELVPIQTIEFYSENANYENEEPGAWNLTKSAKWTSKTTAEVKISIDSIAKLSGKNKDVVLVLDNSSSMEQKLEGDKAPSKLESIKLNAEELIRDTLDNQDSRIALISFATDANIVTPFTNNIDELLTGLNSMEAYGSTNYYKALVKVEEILENYVFQDGRSVVVLFVTDGLPVKQTPLEIYEYYAIKSHYPSVTINAVQYAMGDAIIPQLEAISDNQYIVQISTQLDKALFEAASVPYYYSSFNVSDLIDTNYWSLVSANANIGTVIVDKNDGSINWDLDRYFRPGYYLKPELVIVLHLNEEFHEIDGRWPISVRESVSSTIVDGADENVNRTNTPVLQHKYDVSYDANLPSGCASSIQLPETSRYFVYDVVEIQDIIITCDDYEFKGWQIATAGVSRINNDHFRMPSADIAIRAVWTKPSISKSMDGIVHKKVSAMFANGSSVNTTMKNLANAFSHNSSTYSIDELITSIRRSSLLSSDVDITDNKFILSSYDSEAPIYGWFDNGILYYYSEADDIYMNPDSSYMFHRMLSLADIDSLSTWNTSKVTNLNYLFGGFNGEGEITNLDPLANWDVSNVATLECTFCRIKKLTNIDGIMDWNVSNVTNMNYTFYNLGISNTDAIANWDVSNATKMRGIFSANNSLTDLGGLSEWNTSNVTDLSNAFSGIGASNIDDLANWNVSNVQDMSLMFSNTNNLDNIDGAINWDTSNVTNMSQMFDFALKLTNIDGAINWDTSSVTSFYQMFDCVNKTCSLTNIDGAINWDTSSVTTMTMMFWGNNAIKNIDGAINWDTSSVTNMSQMFWLSGITNINGARNWDTSSVTTMDYMLSATSLTNIDGARNWDTSSVTSMSNMFNNAGIQNIDALANWNTSKVKNMNWMFWSANNLENIDGASKWDTSSVTNMSGMFYNFLGRMVLNNIDGAKDWDVSHVTNMSEMFRQTKITNLDALSKWDVSSVTNMNSMFYSTQLNNISGVADWQTSSLTNTASMFSGTSITNLYALSRWDTSKITNMGSMFSAARNLSDISGALNWDTSSVTNMNSLFASTNISSTNALQNWDLSSVTNTVSMFSSISTLSDLNGLEEWDVSSVTNMNSMFYNDQSITSLSPLENWTITNLENASNMFEYIPDSIIRPSWYANFQQ